MGKVVAQIKVMPEGKDTDLDSLEDSIEEALPESAELSGVAREEVAFGLVALMVNVMVEDEEGGTEDVEATLADLPDVESANTENVGRV